MAKKLSKAWIVIPIVLAVGGILGYKYWISQQSALPAGIASGNGRIEAKLTDISAKEPLRVKQILVDEGDLVKPGQVLVRLDTSTIEAELAKNEAAVAAAREELATAKTGIATAKADVAKAIADVTKAFADVASANGVVAQQQAAIKLAQIEVDRERRMMAENATSQRAVDVRNTNLDSTKATLSSAEARANAAQSEANAAKATADAARSRVGTAQAQADVAQRQIDVALGQVAVTKSRIKDATLISPVTGRVLYRLAEPGEVLAPGGKALTVVNLDDVYMEIFLPSDQAAALKLGDDARITVDYEPNASAAANVSFVSPEAQFTPKQVETKSEREKLMFRVKIQVPPELVAHYVERIKTGVRGVGYVKVNAAATWPNWLEAGLVNKPEGVPTTGSSRPSPTSK
jgi:HlyD family secretion protein